MNGLFDLWGKTVAGDPMAFHPALYHMLDAAQVARVLLGPAAPTGWRQALGRALGCGEDTACATVPWLVALHDLGKCSQAFQEMVPEQRARLAERGVPFGRRAMSTLRHPVVGAAAWAALQSDPIGALPEPLSWAACQVVGGHHGVWLKAGQTRDAARRIAAMEPRYWAEARSAAVEWLWEQLHPACPDGNLNLSTAIMCLSGFTILCDWLASDERFFPAAPDVAPEAYGALSEERARDAVRSAGFLQPSSSAASTAFGRLFADLGAPRPLQETVDAIPADLLAEPVLACIEAPTGEGKTEAALALAHRIGALRGTDALYYALPTMATSNQMFRRLKAHLTERLGLDAESRLVHGQAHLLTDDLAPRPLPDGSDEEHPMQSWFAPLKRALLAPFGVGTIDQAELAVLNVRHVALRAAGLAGKVVILDEVHAYDVYMTTIIERLLEWLRALGSSVIVLSATLPASRRRALIEAWTGAGAVPAAGDEPYPRLEIVSAAGRHVAAPPAFQPGRTIALGWLDVDEDAAEAQAAWLLARVAAGGCACWIANTVAGAQDLYRALRAQASDDLPLTLLHSRFPVAERERLEGEIMARYGPDSPDRRRGIVVGTQVLEQSLDLDFDLLATDLAPVDLLLQRAGRLHRHERPSRPLPQAALWVNVPRQPGGAPAWGANAAIYAEYILRRTLGALAGRQALHLPADYRPLIEAVYADEAPADPDLMPSWEAYTHAAYAARKEAQQRLVPAPFGEEAFCTAAAELHFQEQEDSAGWGIAQTRLGAESVTLLPLERHGRWANVPSAGLRVALHERPAREAALTLLRHCVRVSHRDVVRVLGQAPRPDMELFRYPLLANVRPLWLENARGRLGPHGEIGVVLDPELGLVIERAEKGDDA